MSEADRGTAEKHQMKATSSMLGLIVLATAFGAVAAPALPVRTASPEGGAIYEWVDANGRLQASDTVPDKYKATARRIDPDRSRLSESRQQEAQRPAASLKARATSGMPPQPQTARPVDRIGAAVSMSRPPD